MRRILLVCLTLLATAATPGCRLPRRAPPAVATPKSAELEQRIALLRDDARDAEIAASLAGKDLAGVVIERLETPGRSYSSPGPGTTRRSVIRGDGTVEHFEIVEGFGSRLAGEESPRPAARGSVPAAQVKRLLVKFLKADFFNLPAPQRFSRDSGLTSLSLTFDGKERRGAKVELFELLDQVLIAAGIRGTCGESASCKGSGMCTPRDGWCVVASDADCHRSYDCKSRGQCTARDGVCVATSAAQCRELEDCKLGGQCQASRGVCVALTDADCRRAKWCVRDGMCGAKNGECVATPEGCRASQRCKSMGSCTPVGRYCEAGNTRG
jgi:hypothetical protein